MNKNTAENPAAGGRIILRRLFFTPLLAGCGAVISSTGHFFFLRKR